ncbi:MAG: hypothetical protein LC798_13120 [Chloroflexi bacterium]|nr:hypothetical protein [Chloroflexota bacterium]
MATKQCSGKTCTAQVRWVRNIATGAKLCLDAEEVPDGELLPGHVGVVGGSGRVLKGEHLDGGYLTEDTRERCHPDTAFYRPHWGSCPDRRQFVR